MVWDPSSTKAFDGRRVLVTGHTGFKGTWLCLWLDSLGAEVTGLSLPADVNSLYLRAGLAGRWPERLEDIRTYSLVDRSINQLQPEIIFHLAAQPIVSASYDDPMGTFTTNALGTMHVLEAARRAESVVGCIVVTTDKVYRPTPDGRRHVEGDPLGAHDPYSASKAAAEHVVDAWRAMTSRDARPTLVSARAGNVIGGGDFAANRLLPDLVRAFSTNSVCEIRRPGYTRPWQHVLDPLSGYLALGASIIAGRPVPESLNFGPEREETVAVVADFAASAWGAGATWREVESGGMSETPALALDSNLALRTLGWSPTWTTQEAVSRTVGWWQRAESGTSPVELCLNDIDDFTAASKSA